jgi:hypothetical protein
MRYNEIVKLYEADGSISTLRKEIIDQVKQTQDEELLDKIYTVLNKSGLTDRIAGTLKRETDTEGYVADITKIIIDTDGTYQEKHAFIEGFPNGYVNVKLMLSGQRVKFEDLLDKNAFVRRVFDALKRVTFGTAKGPGEFALAVMSPHIRITGKGDLNIGQQVIEVKASAGKEVSSGGGRLGTPGLLHSDNVENIIVKHLKINPEEAYPSGGLGLGGLTKLASTVKPAVRAALGRDLFKYIFHGLANTGELVSTLTDGGDLRNAYIKANYEAYRTDSEFDGIMIMNFALGELHYFKDVSDMVRHIYKGVGVYLVSTDKAAQARQILCQVTLAPFNEPPVVLPDQPDNKMTPKLTKQFEEKIQNFAIDFAQERNITDPEIISSIYHSTMESFEKGIPGLNILKKLKTKYPKPKQGAAPPAPKIVPAKPIPPVDTIQAPTTTPTPRPGG